MVQNGRKRFLRDAIRSSLTIVAWLWLTLPLAGCSESAPPAPAAEPQPVRALPPLSPQTLSSGGTLTPLGYDTEVNSRVASVDMDGDGRQEIAVASASELVVIRLNGQNGDQATVVWTADTRGGATAIASADLDADGRRDLAVGWGVHRDHLDAEAQLVVYRSAGGPKDTWIEELVVAPTTSRAQFSSIHPTSIAAGEPAGLLYAHFASKYEVRGAFAALGEMGRWTDRGLERIRMGSEWVATPKPGESGGAKILVVGRPYGDESKSHGDVFAIGEDGSRTRLESVRGVRSLAAVRLGSPDSPISLVCYGDGWHWRYRAEAKGYLTCAEQDEKGSWTAKRVAETESYSVANLAAGDLDGDGALELLAQGPVGLYRFVPTRVEDGSLSWSQQKIGPGGYDFAVVDVDGDGRDEIAVAGEKPALLRWRADPDDE